MSINDKIAYNLQNFMKKNNISANTIAKVGNVTPSTITRFLSREIKSLNIETIQKIADYYKEPMGSFIHELKNTSKNNATLNDNDLVVIDKNFSLSLNGVYVIKDDINGLRVKRLDKDKDGNLKVISDNKNYETQIYTVEEMQDETIIILGKVTAKIAGV